MFASPPGVGSGLLVSFFVGVSVETGGYGSFHIGVFNYAALVAMAQGLPLLPLLPTLLWPVLRPRPSASLVPRPTYQLEPNRLEAVLKASYDELIEEALLRRSLTRRRLLALRPCNMELGRLQLWPRLARSSTSRLSYEATLSIQPRCAAVLLEIQ